MKHTILFTGGGTLGPVTPLLAVAKEWQEREPDVQVEWIGTPTGPERDIVERYGYIFHSLKSPKLSRHKWWTWPIIVPALTVSCLQARKLLKTIRPDIVFSAGGFTSIPVVWMAKLMSIPSWIHQLDVTPGLANRLMAPFASRISVTWEQTAQFFGIEKTLVVGGMMRTEIVRGDRERFLREYKFDSSKKLVLILGGGTGAEAINNALQVIVEELVRNVNIFHVTGPGKMLQEEQYVIPGYVVTEFIDAEIKDAFAAADVVVSRAGMGTILELIGLQKPAVLIPIPASHQVENARMADEIGFAHVIYNLTPQVLQQEIHRLVMNGDLRKVMQTNARKSLPMHAEKGIVNKAMELV